MTLSKPRIDSHQHFWRYHPTHHSWMTSEMEILKRDYFPEELLPLLRSANLDGCVAVQASQTEEENIFLLSLAAQHDFIKGIVGWVDLQSDKLAERLAYYKKFEKLKGFRHIIQDELDIDFMLHPNFLRGVGQLSAFGYTYDILIYPMHLPNAITFVNQFPEQLFVVDHLAKPCIRDRKMEPWKDDLKKLARHKNMFCKISGMVTEANWTQWTKADFIPYMDSVVDSFGFDRIMFGSDWPVCTVASSYTEMYEVVFGYFSQFSVSEQDKFYGQNASRFYNL